MAKQSDRTVLIEINNRQAEAAADRLEDRRRLCRKPDRGFSIQPG